MRTLLVALLVLAAVPAAADMRINGAGLQLYVPGVAWAVRLPRGDWQVLEEKRKPDGTGAYYFVASPSKEVQFSVYIDATGDCSSGPTCREQWKRNAGRAFENALGPSELERNGFSVLQFHLDRPMNAPVVQANLSAHAYRDGRWIDMRVTKVGEKRPAPAVLLAVVDSVSIQSKSLDGPRQYAAGSGKYLAMDVPAAWKDQLVRGSVGTVELAPAAGDAFKVMMTVTPPKQADAAAITREQLLEIAKRAASDAKAQAVEATIEPRELRGRSALGYRINATDKNPAPGEYRHMAQGVLAVGNVQVMFTILSRDGEEKSVAAALDALASLRFAP